MEQWGAKRELNNISLMLDTCVIIDALHAAANEKFTGATAAKAVTDIDYLNHRNAHNGKATRTALQNLVLID